MKVVEPVKLSGAFKEIELVTPLSFKTILLAYVPLPCTVTFPVSVAEAAFTLPAVSILVVPVIKDDPAIVPVLMVGAVSVLLVRLAAPASVTITPALGNVADELIPVPPKLAGSSPVTAAG